MLKEDSPITPPLAAVQFLTIIPPIIRRPFTLNELGQSTAYYPLVGALIGGLLVGIDTLSGLIFPLPVRSAILLASWVLMSGALHLDGFLDTCDGLFGGYKPERRLEIMRDERVGAYGFTGGVILLLVKFSALYSLDPGIRSTAILIAPILGRWSMSLALIAFPYARERGLGKDIKDHSSWKQLAIASMIALGFVGVSAGWIGLLGIGCTTLVTWVIVRYTLGRIPGLTGDIYGAINEITETIILLFVLIAQPYFG